MQGPIQRTGQRACHVRIRDVAKAAAGEYYEAIMGANNDIYKQWLANNPGLNAKQLERKFINRYWPDCIDFARTTLGLVLNRDDVPDKLKDEILDILHKDQYLRQSVPLAPFRGPAVH
jgi:hypothetical protein